jgi:hypothetical protein
MLYWKLLQYYFVVKLSIIKKAYFIKKLFFSMIQSKIFKNVGYDKLLK